LAVNPLALHVKAWNGLTDMSDQWFQGALKLIVDFVPGNIATSRSVNRQPCKALVEIHGFVVVL